MLPFDLRKNLVESLSLEVDLNLPEDEIKAAINRAAAVEKSISRFIDSTDFDGEQFLDSIEPHVLDMDEYLEIANDNLYLDILESPYLKHF